MSFVHAGAVRFERLRSVDLNLLLAFSELFRAGSVTVAAARLGVTQSAMSRTLARLRGVFGDALFLRGRSALQPTPRAVALAGPIDALLEAAEGVVGGAPAFEPSTAGRTFTISTADYGQVVLLPKLLAQLARQAPRVSLRVVPTLHQLDEPLEQGDLDLAWVPRQTGSRAVVWGRLFDEAFTFVVRRGHPVTRRRLTLDRFCALRHVALAPASHSAANPVDAVLARLGRRREVVATVPNFLAVPPLLERNDVAAILPRRVFEAVAARYRLTALELPFALEGFSLEQCWHERSRRDAGHAWLRQRVVELAKTV